MNQIKRYEANTAQPTLETLVRLAKALHVTLDELVFSEETRGPSDEFRMQFEALTQFDDQEKLVARELLDSLILKHTANQLSKILKISQQMVGAYEIGSRKIPASMLPVVAKLFAVPLEQLMGVDKQPAKRGPASVLQRQIEQVGLMPRNKQKVIAEVLEAMIKQQQAS